MKVNKQCKECRQDFLADTRELKRGNAIFCSRSCAKSHQNKNIVRQPKEPNCNCEFCGKQFYKPKSRLDNKTGNYFCSRECKDKHQATQLTYSKDYRRTVKLTKGIEECERCGYNEHPEILQVHHKDRNRGNNSLENLEVLCPNCHELEHKRGISVIGCTPDLHSGSTSSNLVFSTDSLSEVIKTQEQADEFMKRLKEC